jgi:formylglycine-generating enzyme required for sulfatase activity
MSHDGKNAQRQETIPHDFYMGVYPVTQGEWSAIMGNNPSSFSRTGSDKEKVKGIPGPELARFPVESVSWDDCQEFLKRLNEREKEIGWLYRLPTEAEWEHACRGGATSKTDCSFDFYFKDKLSNSLTPELANFSGSGIGRPTEVGSYPENALGLCDMHGNIWEWCQDWFRTGSSRVYRGGGWSDGGAGGCRAAHRGGHTPDSRGHGLGFRVARVPSGSTKW